MLYPLQLSLHSNSSTVLSPPEKKVAFWIKAWHSMCPITKMNPKRTHQGQGLRVFNPQHLPCHHKNGLFLSIRSWGAVGCSFVGVGYQQR